MMLVYGAQKRALRRLHCTHGEPGATVCERCRRCVTQDLRQQYEDRAAARRGPYRRPAAPERQRTAGTSDARKADLGV